MTLIVCSAAPTARRCCAERAPSHLMTLLGPDDMIETPAGLRRRPASAAGRRTTSTHPTDGMVAPDARDGASRCWRSAAGWDARAPMVVHCFAGISRSTASAFAIACDRNPDADEMDDRPGHAPRRRPAFPNRRIVALADDILGRRGRMVDAVEAMGGNNFVAERRSLRPAGRAAAMRRMTDDRHRALGGGDRHQGRRGRRADRAARDAAASRRSCEGLPFGPFDPDGHRTFELALREFVTRQTRFELGFVEQLYTFGDKGRDAPLRRRRRRRGAGDLGRLPGAHAAGGGDRWRRTRVWTPFTRLLSLGGLAARPARTSSTRRSRRP